MWEYTDKMTDYFLNPRNVGEIEDPDGVAEVGSIACGEHSRNRNFSPGTQYVLIGATGS